MGAELTEFIDELNTKYENTYCMNDNSEFIDDEVLRSAGFCKLNLVDWIKKDITAWEKALYYFCKIEVEHEYVWFIEDDVFIPSVDLIAEIDAKHPDADLLCKQHFSKVESPSWSGWKMSEHTMIEGPYYQSICCAVRISRRLLSAIQDFAALHKRLIFLEFFFNTLAVQKGFKIETPAALKFIHFDRQPFIFNKNYMYHPVKNYKLHPVIRKNIGSPPVLHYLTVATKPHPNLNKIIDTLSKNGDTITILGLDMKSDMNGFGIKLNYIKDFIKDLDNSDILLCTDAYDITIKASLFEIERRFVSTGAKILFGAEKGCWPDAFKAHLYKTADEEYPYLNAGAFIGYIGYIKALLGAITIYQSMDDQRLWTDMYLKTGLITLDHSNKIFLNMFKATNVNTGALIIHYNGDSKALMPD